MNKKKKINRTKVDTVRSVNNNIRSSVRKLNPILKAIVGKKVEVAIRELQFSAKRITREIRKTVSSAVANAENNNQYDIDKLIVKEAYCGKKVVMNPVDHPHGGGEGKTAGGRHPVSPTGQSAKGLKTRDNKRTDKFIIRRRKKRNKR